MRRSAVFLFLAALLLSVAVSCGGDHGGAPSPTPAAGPTPTVSETPGPAPAAELPTRDLVDLAHRLAGLQGNPPDPVNALPPNYQVGDRHLFSIVEMAEAGAAADVPPRVLDIWATLQLVTPHAYFYVQDGESFSADGMAKAGQDFEERIYPTVTAAMGSERNPGIDDDPRITIFHGRIQGAAGYFSDMDEYPRQVSPISNEREMVYLDLPSLEPGSDIYDSILAHELQHLIHFNGNPYEDVWVNEGLSVVASGLVGSYGGMSDSFFEKPDTQLNEWDPTGDNNAHYGAAGLFCRYLAQRSGGTSELKDLVFERQTSIAGVNDFLSRHAAGLDFSKLFADWTVANYLNDPSGIYGYPGLEGSVSPTATLTGNDSGQDTVHQFAADYVDVQLSGKDGTFSFDGDQTVPLLADQAHSGSSQWWSGRGDSIDTTLTRELDLSGLTSATLDFWTWFDIERWYDYGYVEVSTDGGDTWQILGGRQTSDEDPVRQAYGPAYTGRSGGGDTPAWVEESMDLTPFAGQRVLLRFEYVTDGSLNTSGWAVDDIGVPELGFVDDAETDGDWTAKGFQRISGPVPQRFLVQLIEQGDQTRVRQIDLDASNHATIDIPASGAGVSKATIVIAAATEDTSETAHYTYSLTTQP